VSFPLLLTGTVPFRLLPYPLCPPAGLRCKQGGRRAEAFLTLLDCKKRKVEALCPSLVAELMILKITLTFSDSIPSLHPVPPCLQRKPGAKKRKAEAPALEGSPRG